MKNIDSSTYKVVALYVLINFLATIFAPSIALALTSGPSSPEFSSFSPVSSSDMVNVFSGDFKYNLPVVEVPGPHGSGYSMSLNYNPGGGMEDEASWVGFGWSLNPGSINRTLRGFPDEYDGQEINYYNKTRPNWTATSSISAGMELFSSDLSIGLNAGSIHRMNNYTGYQKVSTWGMNVWGAVGVNATNSVNGTTYDGFISPIGIIRAITSLKEQQKDDGDFFRKSPGLDGEREYTDDQLKDNAKAARKKQLGGAVKGGIASNYAVRPQNTTAAPFISQKYNGFTSNWSTSMQMNPGTVPIGVERGNAGTFSFKVNEPSRIVKAYGYPNTKLDKSYDGNWAEDYHVEKDKAYQTVDNYTGIPFGNYDVFNVTGEGVVGSYRTYLPELGNFSLKETKSELSNLNVGFEVMIGTNIGVGLDFGIGQQETTVGEWLTNTEKSNQELNILRFNNDLGGEVVYDEGNTLIDEIGSTFSGFYTAPYSECKHTGSSSYIDEAKSSGVLNGASVINKSGVKFNYNEPLLIRNASSIMVDVNANDYEIKNKFLAFGPLKLNKSGSKYGFAEQGGELYEPEHMSILGQINTNEYSSSLLLTEILQPGYVDFDNIEGASDGDLGGWTKFHYREVFGKSNSNWYRYRMPFKGMLYSQNSISDPKDDMGTVETGEKEVKYLQKIETKTHIAYFITNKTNLDNPYLKGSQIGESNKGRYDGIGADELTNSEDPAAKSGDMTDFSGASRLEYLEKIVLFAKNPNNSNPGLHGDQKPIKTVRFEYDYSLVPNVANNANSSYSYSDILNTNSSNSGKLTLRKVWFEYEGIVSARISPYIFNYKYPNPKQGSKLATLFQSQEYQNILNGGDIQNAPYAPYALNGWGTVTPNSTKRRASSISWIDQSVFLDKEIEYDPAAYHLKSIKLPSGGTIHIQYEKKDYAYVQDREVMAMAKVSLCKQINSGDSNTLPIYEVNNGASPSYGGNDEYLIHVESLGVSSDDEEGIDYLVNRIYKYFNPESDIENTEEDSEELKKERKVYYKFLFGLTDKSPSLDNYQSEYITGYAGFQSVEKVRVSEADKNQFGIKLVLKGKSKFKKDEEIEITPRKACWDFVANYRQGKINGSDGIDPSIEKRFDEQIIRIANGKYVDYKGQLLTGVVTPAILSLVTGLTGNGLNNKFVGNIKEKDPRIATQIHADLSFIKLPMLRNKVAGGARVKRILLHDNGIEDGDEVLIGTEYHYVLEDGVTSSGVATNEPASLREENPLVTFLPNKGQSTWDRLITGQNLTQNEGPIGESLLPGPSIGYSRVVMENIHKGATGNGFSIDKYFTAKDFPFDKVYPRGNNNEFDISGKAADHTKLQKHHDEFDINGGLFMYATAMQRVSQGYRFIQTNMHGLPHSMLTYAGNYSDYLFRSQHDSSTKYTGKNYIVTGEEFEYYQPGEKVKMVSYEDKIITQELTPGKEMDIARESKKVSDVSVNLSVEVDVSFSMPGMPAIFVSAMPSFTYTENHLYSHTTSKVISYPTILKSTIKTIEGISSKSENLAFDKNTGDPILVRTSDSYANINVGDNKGNNNYYSFSIPACWVNDEMGQKALSDNNASLSKTNQLDAQMAQFLVLDDNPLDNEDWMNKPEELIAASISTFKNGWGTKIESNDKILAEYGINKSDITYDKKRALDAIWLPHCSYTYKTIQDEKNEAYSKGTFKISEPINWLDIVSDKNWIKASEITKYSPHLDAIEERNALDIKSAVLYGSAYLNSVPTMVCNNSDYESIYFNSYENHEYGIIDSHSGKYSIKLRDMDNMFDGFKLSNQVKTEGSIVKFWLNKAIDDLSLQLNGSSTNTVKMNLVSSINGWTLYEGFIKADENLSAINIGASFSGVLNISDDTLIDDVRLQPSNSSSNCFVYDCENLRLLAQFDDQHFGTFYQYNQEGQLISKLIETESGLMTLQETNYNTSSKLRY
ncbi:hypothetical protein [Saccharicrinis aurantiacus]|uniref:hypothetical protein n=1 Tax=Saccharicrinis aurantiacus TaxID=1849719 RepID=UPI000838D741|nr:hypothetical protein [Saccharicrinis aurantiacus]